MPSTPNNEDSGVKKPRREGRKRAVKEEDKGVALELKKNLKCYPRSKQRVNCVRSGCRKERAQETLDDVFDGREVRSGRRMLRLAARSPSPKIRAFRLPGDYSNVKVKMIKKRRLNGITATFGLGDEDYISLLPNDCLLIIFDHLNRKDLSTMKCVSRRMHEIASHRSLYQCKSAQFGCVSTTQIVNGYSFTLSTYDLKDKKKQKVKTLVYKIQVTDTGGTNEDQQVKRGQHLYATRLIRSIHNLPVPDRFCKVMGNLINRFAEPNVVFSRIRIDADILTNLFASVAGMERLYIEHSTCDDNTKDSFLRFVNATRIVDLTIIGCPQILENGLINVQFMMSMENSSLKNLRVMESWENNMKNRFYPSKSMVPLLTRYDSLILPSLTVDANWIGELVIARLNRFGLESSRFWNIGVDRKPNSDEIMKQISSHSDFEYKTQNGMHRVIKKSNGAKAHFDVVPISVNGSHLYILDINFSVSLSDTSTLPYFRWLNNGGTMHNIKSHLESTTAEYRPNLLNALSLKQPQYFFSSVSFDQLNHPMQDRLFR